MTLHNTFLDAVIEKFIKNGMIVGIGSSSQSDRILKSLGYLAQEKNHKYLIVPSSIHIATKLSDYYLGIANLDEHEIDIAFEFCDRTDSNFNFVKTNSTSLVRDKMIAQSASELIGIVERKNYKEDLSGIIPFEISSFAPKRTVNQLSLFGEAELKMNGKTPYKTETNHNIVDVKIEPGFSPEEIEIKSKEIPGVLETGLFLGHADRMIIHNSHVEMKSRIGPELKFNDISDN